MVEGRRVPGGFDTFPPPAPSTPVRLPGAVLGRLTERSNAKGLAHLALHLGLIGAAGALYAAVLGTAWMLPAAWVYGTLLVFLFAPLHETVHGTAFRSRSLNRAVSAACGWILLLPPRYFRAFHFEHHRHTQDPERDPELAQPPPDTWREYLWRVTGVPYWVNRIRVMALHAAGGVPEPWIAGSKRRRIILEARLFLGSYAAIGAVSGAVGSAVPIWCWIVPALLGQPMLRLYLMAEHTGCSNSHDMIENSRTTHTNALMRFIAWNMPFHAEHHAYAAVPFHALPRIHAELAPRIRCQSPGYVRVHRELARSFGQPRTAPP